MTDASGLTLPANSTTPSPLGGTASVTLLDNGDQSACENGTYVLTITSS